VKAVESGLATERAAVTAHFERALGWPAIAERTVREYRLLVDAKQAVA
jgi:Arc/MetJ family transcription regulator